jgi:hypothetical protein
MRSFFDWADHESMFLPMDTCMYIWRCRGMVAAELLVFLESGVWEECEELAGCTEQLVTLHKALLNLAGRAKAARSLVRRVLEFSFRDAELAALWSAARAHTLEWTAPHGYLCTALRSEDVLNVSTRHDLRRYCMHGLKTVTPILGDVVSLPRLHVSDTSVFASCVSTSTSVWDAYASFRKSVANSGGAVWLHAVQHYLVGLRPHFPRIHFFCSDTGAAAHVSNDVHRLTIGCLFLHGALARLDCALH